MEKFLYGKGHYHSDKAAGYRKGKDLHELCIQQRLISRKDNELKKLNTKNQNNTIKKWGI